MNMKQVISRESGSSECPASNGDMAPSFIAVHRLHPTIWPPNDGRLDGRQCFRQCHVIMADTVSRTDRLCGTDKKAER
jgi:hypothetical protein